MAAASNSGCNPQVAASRLHPALESLIGMIIEEAAAELKFSAIAAPWGKLTQREINYYCFQSLRDFKRDRNCIKKRLDFLRGEINKTEYTPFTRNRMANEESILQHNLSKLWQCIFRIMEKLWPGNVKENPIDRHYRHLNCKLDPLERGSEDFQTVYTYLHRNKPANVILENIFRCDKEKETINFIDYGNRMLLWHGSFLCNWVGILSEGLKIAPWNAYSAGRKIGDGVYFADMFSNSLYYCRRDPFAKRGLLLLCDVSLGNINDLMENDKEAHNLPIGKHSVRRLGKLTPSDLQDQRPSDRLRVPEGEPVETNVNNGRKYNVYVVYDTRQIRMKYVVQVMFQ